MWNSSNAHDEYAASRIHSSPPRAPQRAPQQRKKRPTRPKRNDKNSHEDIQPDASSNSFKYRGKGKKENKKKANPWDGHAHDEYAQPKTNKKEHGSSKKTSRTKPQRPVRIRFETDEDDDNHPEEKSNRPLKKKPRRPKKGPSYISAANIHAQQFRSGYRAKPLPPDPSLKRRTNKQRVAYGKAQFDAMCKQAASAEGLDKTDVRVQRMIQRLGDQMAEVSGFNRFLQNRDAELAKIVNKQQKRRKTVNKLQKNMQHERTPSPHIDDDDHKYRKGSVKDLTARFEKKSVQNSRRHRHNNRRIAGQAHRNALKLPNTKSHRRRVSSQFSVAAISAVLSANSKGSSLHANSPFLADVDFGLGFDDNISNSGHTSGHEHNNTLLVANDNRRMSRDSRASFSRGSRLSVNAPSVIMLEDADSNNPRLIISTPLPDDDADGMTSSVFGDDRDPLKGLLRILQREPVERTDEEIDILVSFFENYQIMTEDVDCWSGKATFRSFICQTRHKSAPAKEYIFREGDDGDVFYFVLRGNVSVLVDDASTVHTGSKRHASQPKMEIHTVEENHVFGEIAMFNQGKRSATCVAKTDTHLAYWDRATYDEFIRPMKELKKKAQKILRDKGGHMLSEDQLIEKAAMFLDDAMHGRELKMHRNGPWPRRIHKLINHKYFNYCLVMVSMLYLSLIFIEPPSWRDSTPIELTHNPQNIYSSRIMPLIAFEWFVFLIFAAECGLRFYSFGSSWFFTIDLHVARVILLIIFGCDLIIACIYGGYSLRFSRFVRPIFAILFIRDLRRQYYIVLACIPYIIELLFLWGIIAAIFARIGYHIFYHSEGHLIDGHTRVSMFMRVEFEHGWDPYNDKMGEYCFNAEHDPNMKSCDQFFDSYVWVSFDTFFKSIIALFALLTTENFPDVWWPTWLHNQGKPYWAFFVIYILISVFFLLNLFSAAVYDAYQHIISKLDVIDERRETQALKVAWICLDTGDRGAIGYQKFENLMFRLKPEYTEFEIGVIFKLLDPDNNHLIDAEDFSVMMINVLYLSISRKIRSKDDDLKLYLQKLGGSCPFGYEILRVFRSERWRYIMLVVQSIDIFSLLCYHQYPAEFNVMDFCCVLIILFALVLEVIFKHMSDLATYFKSSRNRLYFGLTLIQSCGSFIGIFDDREWLSALRFFGMLRILIVAIFAVEKIKFLRTGLTRTLTQTVVFMIPVFGRIVVYTSVVLLYVYTVIGTEIFVNPSDSASWGTNRCDPPYQLQNDPYALFCDANMAIITLTQILTTNNWHIIMYTAIQVTDNWPNALYFMTFFFLGPILVLSLLLAMFFNMFFGVTMQSEHELSAWMQETDIEAKNLQEHMELQEVKEQIDEELQELRNFPLPTECGISQLPDGSKVLTVKKVKINDSEEEEVELVHIPLHNVARDIWENIPGKDWIDQTSQTFKQTFNGREATLYLLTANFAPNDEEAVDTLAVIMDEIGAFMRVDPGKEQEFENDIDAHYQWIIIPDDEDENKYDEELPEIVDDDNQDDEVALEDIMIGFRHSYGGYHRLLKQYRQAGIDPTQESARVVADRTKMQFADTPLSQSEHPNETNIGTPADLVKEIPNHIRNQSQKIKQYINKKNETTTIIKLNIIDDTVNTDVVMNGTDPVIPDPIINESQPNSPKEIPLKGGTTDSKRNLLKGKSEGDLKTTDKSDENNKNKASLKKANSLKGSKMLPIKSQRNNLQRTASSKNILLRHLDSKPRKGLF